MSSKNTSSSQRRTSPVRLGGIALSLALAGSLVVCPAFANAEEHYPAALDLRHYGGSVNLSDDGLKSVITDGVNYVSPVKNQAPFDSCWSFSVCAAAETSLLTALDKSDDGEMNGSIDYEKAANGQTGNLGEAASDLSEKHLALGAFSHPVEGGAYSSQAGEGNYLTSGSTEGDVLMNVGGVVTHGATVLSAGIGPITESLLPYTGSEGSLSQELTYGAIAELTNSNILETTAGDGLTDDEKSAMKHELNEGRAISISYHADQSLPSQQPTAESTYLNTDTWAQYTYEEASANHTVTIVGYDDDYDASNFTHNQYKTDENDDLVLDGEKTAKTTPEGNGAWIVKNSWGPSDNDDPLAVADWGVDGSGYFYLSYYDKTIGSMESFEFDASEEGVERSNYAIAQYDLAMTNPSAGNSSESIVKTCNVFGSEELGISDSGHEFSVRDFGCMTSAPNDTVTMDLYIMDASADVATVLAGEPTVTVTEPFDFAGFHRIRLTGGIVVKQGQKVAVVQTTTREDGSYEYVYGKGNAKEYVDALNALGGDTPITSYTKAVVNRGESLIFQDGSWRDWSDESSVIDAAEAAAVTNQMQGEGASFSVSSVYAIDNFAIKLYGKATACDKPTNGGQKQPTGKAQTITGKTSKTVTYKAAKKGKYAKKLSKTKTVKSLKTLFGLKAKTSMSFDLVSVNKAAMRYVTVSKAGKVTIKKGLKKGTYTLKVKVTAAKSAIYRTTTNTITLKCKVK